MRYLYFRLTSFFLGGGGGGVGGLGKAHRLMSYLEMVFRAALENIFHKFLPIIFVVVLFGVTTAVEEFIFRLYCVFFFGVFFWGGGGGGAGESLSILISYLERVGGWVRGGGALESLWIHSFMSYLDRVLRAASSLSLKAFCIAGEREVTVPRTLASNCSI